MRTFVILAAALAAGTAVADRPVTAISNIAWHAQYDVAYREMQNLNRPMLVFIKSNACLYCQRMESQTYNHPEVIQAINRRFIPTVINSATDPALAKQFGVTVYPTTVIIASNGTIVDSIPGYLPADQFQARLRTAKVR